MEGTPSNPLQYKVVIYNDVNSSRDSVYLVQEEGYGGSSILGVFRHCKKQSLLERNSKKYIK